MNYIEVLGGGFNGTSKTWRFIRDMIVEVHDLATALGGENCIVKGCEVNNGVAAEGIVIIAGEVYPFIGGAVKGFVKVVEAVEPVEYFTDSDGDGQGDLIDGYFNRHVEFADAGTPFSDLKRISSLSEIARRIPPKKCALDFWGSVDEIPDGWQLCDGTNGTPDLSGMFSVGLDPNDPDHNEVGKTGGAHKVTLTENQIPAHRHSGSVYIKGHSHELPKSVVSNEGGSGDGNMLTNKDNISSTVITRTSTVSGYSANVYTQDKGGGESHENRPKYYTFAKIAQVG